MGRLFERPRAANCSAVVITVDLQVMGQRPKDLQPGLINKKPDPSQLEFNEYVDRSRRMHRNDLENIPAFWVAGLLFILVDPALWLVQVLMYGFVVARLAHFWAYATKQTHEVRATFYTVGSVIVIYMTLHVLWVALY